MNGIAFSLTPRTQLIENSRGYFLFSQAPLRVLGVNQGLFRILKDLQKTQEYAGIVSSVGTGEGRLLRILMGLVARGYLTLASLPTIDKFPAVSIIIPARNSAQDLEECLASLMKLDYPSEKLEFILVDDGSTNALSAAVNHFPVKVLRNEHSLGPAAARNRGAAEAGGRYLAFLDADCVADPEGLSQLIPFFAMEKLGAIGGLVAGYRRETLLDRYEAVSSSLNMGKRVLYENVKRSTFYVPTCNFLVDSEAFRTEKGFNTSLHLGEDVDFCWRMRNAGRELLYVPYGRVFHKHRNHLDRMLERRFAYGTSEAPLYRAHPEKKKTFPLSPTLSLSVLVLVVSLLILNPLPLAALPIFLGFDLILKRSGIRRQGLRISIVEVVGSTLRGLLSTVYFACFHLCRYYLVLLLLLGILWHPIWIFCGVALLLISIVDYGVKKPRLAYPSYLAYYFLEHITYQSGVVWGCIRQRSVRAYFVRFSATLAL
jgi:mycofactocin glycosyltransferase